MADLVNLFKIVAAGLMVMMLSLLNSCGHPIKQFYPNAPKVVSVSPADGSTGIVVNAVVSATFDRDMDATTINTSSFKLIYFSSAIGDYVQVAGSVSYNGTARTATFTPSGDLSYATIYTAKLLTSMTNSSGDPLENEYDWSFTTASSP